MTEDGLRLRPQFAAALLKHVLEGIHVADALVGNALVQQRPELFGRLELGRVRR